eukprot:Hpha_TRINITY_DN2503_c0_g1::TRINITY_DN2503_c0_g1_i1::g.1517::m.1517
MLWSVLRRILLSLPSPEGISVRMLMLKVDKPASCEVERGSCWGERGEVFERQKHILEVQIRDLKKMLKDKEAEKNQLAEENSVLMGKETVSKFMMLGPHRGGTAEAGMGVGGELQCVSCTQKEMVNDTASMMKRLRDARRQTRMLTLERKKLQEERELFVQAHRIDSDSVSLDIRDLREQSERLRCETVLLAEERRANLKCRPQSPSPRRSRRRRRDEQQTGSSFMVVVDPEGSAAPPSPKVVNTGGTAMSIREIYASVTRPS